MGKPIYKFKVGQRVKTFKGHVGKITGRYHPNGFKQYNAYAVSFDKFVDGDELRKVYGTPCRVFTFAEIVLFPETESE